MDEKSCETLLPSIKGHMINIPNDVQQLTIKDSTVFIGKKHSHRPMSLCFGFLTIVSLLLVFGIGAIILQPTLYRAAKLGFVNAITNSDCNPSFNRNTPDPLSTAMNAPVDPSTSTPSDAFGQNQLNPANNRPDATILYSIRNPYSNLGSFFQITTVYIARAGQTTLSFFAQNAYTTYIDDVSVNNSYGQQLLVNGDFENGTYGWQGLSYTSSCGGYWDYYGHCYSSSSVVKDALSQTFSTTPGSILYISFKLRWTGSGSSMITNVTIYP